MLSIVAWKLSKTFAHAICRRHYQKQSYPLSNILGTGIKTPVEELYFNDFDFVIMSKDHKFESFPVTFSNQKPEKRKYFIVKATF